MAAELPNDLLVGIFSYLDLPDLLNVHLSNHRFHDLSDPLVYARAHLAWPDIDCVAADLDAGTAPDRRFEFMRSAHIDASGSGEWRSSPHLDKLAAATRDRLVELSISCALQSSGWLKYVRSPLTSVKHLHLEASGALQNYSFDFTHLVETVPNIESIDLHGFRIYTDPYERLEHLHRIRVENCTWQYPCRLTDASVYGQLEELNVALTTHMNPFAFSERLQTEMANLPRSLRALNVYIDIGRRVNWNPLKRSKKMPNLLEVSLHGFEFDFYDDTTNESKKFPRLQQLIQD